MFFDPARFTNCPNCGEDFTSKQLTVYEVCEQQIGLN